MSSGIYQPIRREVGMKINALKQAAGDRLQQLKEMFAQNGTTDVRDDLSRTAYPVALGTRHPLSLCVRRFVTSSSVWASPSPKDPR